MQRKINRTLADLVSRAGALCTRLGVAGARMRRVHESLEDGDLAAAERLLRGLVEHTDVEAVPAELRAMLGRLEGVVKELDG